MVGALVTEVNTLHRGGRTLDGFPAGDFFDPTGLTAGDLGLSEGVARSAGNIAAGASGGAGDGSIALGIAGLRSAGSAALGGESLGEFYTGLVATVAVMVRGAEQSAVAQDAMLANVRAQRSSVSDVSTDEEMVMLIRQQQAYSAASRLVNVADEMMQDVLRMV